MKLDHIPITPKDKDRRYRARNEARNYAIISKNGLKKMHTYPEWEAYLEMIKNLALESGFFSVWMEIFKDDDEVKKILIGSFKGTKEEFCGDME